MKRMTANMEINPLQSVVSLLWEIQNFILFMKLHENELESPPFLVKCTEIISFFLTLRPRDDILDCFLYRLNRVDDLGDIYIKYRISVIDPDESMHFSRVCSLKLPKETRSVEILDFLDTKLLREEHMPNGTLRLQLNLGISINESETIAWNCNDGLTSLSTNLLELYKEHNCCNNRVLIEKLRVHPFVLAARCPKLSNFVESDYENVIVFKCERLENEKVDYPGILHFTTLLTLPPKSNFVKRPDRLYLRDTRTSRVHEEMNSLECDAFLRYLYSGRLFIAPQDDEIRFSLLLIARHYNLTDLVRRLQEVPSKSTMVTEMRVDQVSLDFDLGLVKDGKHTDPTTHLVNLSKQEKLYLSVTFSVVKNNGNDMLNICCQLIHCALPTTIKTEIRVYENDLLCPVTTWDDIKTVCYHQDSWSPPDVRIQSNSRVRCIFSVCSKDKVEVTRQEFTLSSTDVIQPKSLRQLSYDFAMAFMSSRKEWNLFYFESLPEEKQMHKIIMCARIPRLQQYVSNCFYRKSMIRFTILENLIEYAYTGLLFERNPINVQKLARIAQHLQLFELVIACNSFLEVNQI